MLFRKKLFLVAIPFLAFFFWFDIWTLGTIVITQFAATADRPTLLFVLPYISGGLALLFIAKALCDWSMIRKLQLHGDQIEARIAMVRNYRENN